MLDQRHSPAVPAANERQALQQSAQAITVHATLRTATHAQMVVSTENARQKDSDVSDLLPLVRSQGLLQNLVAFDQRRNGVATGLLEVVAGKRRHRVIGILIDEGSIPVDFQIPYLLVTEEEGLIVSLAENLGRAAMHPADLFDGMLKLAQRGRSVEDIALVFGSTPLDVRRWLKLARVAPPLFELYRQDKASYEQMAALALSDDHAAQLAVWNGAEPWNRQPQQLRRLLTAQHLDVRRDRVARFVGVKAYEAAGGTVVRDLFSDNGDGYATDAALLEKLATERMQRAARRLPDTGHWIETRTRIDAAELARYGKVRKVVVPLNPEQAQAREDLRAQLAVLRQKEEAEEKSGGDDADGPEGEGEGDSPLGARIQALEAALRQIDTACRAQDSGDLALAGSVLTIGDDGKLVVHRHLIRPDDKGRMVKHGKDAAAIDGAGARPARPVHSDRLTGLLTAQRTLALRAEVVRQPRMALVLLAHRLIGSVFHRRDGLAPLVQVQVEQSGFPVEVKTASAWRVLEERRAALAALLPEAPGEAVLLAWLRDQPEAIVLEFIAFCTACSINAMQDREAPSQSYQLVARALDVKMGDWWQATVANYFAHVRKVRMIEVVGAVAGKPAAVPLEAMKKDAAAAAAERAIANSGWLPELLRSN